MMQCPGCQAELPPKGTECPACGADVGWHIRKPDGSTYGPLDLELIEKCIREARVVAGDMVQLGSDGRFRPVHAVLGDRLATPPPPSAAATARAFGGLSAETSRWLTRGCGIAAGVFLVICLLAVAASIPAYWSARGTALRASCQSNLKQVDLALIMYTSDHDDLPPPPAGWERKLDPYIRNSQLWICPAAPSEVGYAGNHRLSGTKWTDVRRPDQTLSFWDAGVHVQGFSPPPGTTSPRHSGFDNFAFTDGHVEAAQPGQLQAYTEP